MSVAGQTPSEVHLNSTSPAIPAGGLGITFQAGSPYPDPNNPALSVRDVSAYAVIGSPAKGTILVFNGTGWVPLLVGTDGQILEAASSQADGLEWTSGSAGARGSLWYSGSGAPTSIAGQQSGDWYLDTATGNVWNYTGSPLAWTDEGNIKGAAGAAGTNGTSGTRGSLWYSGSGAPTSIAGQQSGDWYLDTATGNTWEYTGSPLAWTDEGNIKGATGNTGATGPTGATGGGATELFKKTYYQNGANTTTQRQFGSVYRNTSGYGKIIIGYYTAGASSCVVKGLVNASYSGSGDLSSSIVFESSAAGAYYYTFMLFVPNNDYYEILVSAGTATFGTWIEITTTNGSQNSGNITGLTDVAGSRGFGGGSGSATNVNSNGNSSAMMVCAVLETNSNASGIPCVYTCYCDKTSTPTTPVYAITAVNVVSTFTTVWFMVPAGSYYQISNSASGSYQPSIAHWYEFVLPFNAEQSADLAAAPAQRGASLGNAGSSTTMGYPTYINNQLKDMFVSVSMTQTSLSNATGIASKTLFPLSDVNGAQQFLNVSAPSTASLAIALWVLLYEFFLLGYQSSSSTLQHWFEYQLY